MHRWKNKVAMVTGASSGIGAAIAETLAKEDVIVSFATSKIQTLNVVGLARRKDKLEQLSEKINKEKKLFHFYVADVSKEQDVLKAFEWTITSLGPIHILINNAGVFRIASLCEGDTDQWKEVLDTNVLGLYTVTSEALKNMAHVDGHIININSLSGHRVVQRGRIYSASKHAITALTETIRQELLSKNSQIKVTDISPGQVETEIFAAAFERIQEPIPDHLVHGRLPSLKPEDVADCVLYVLSTSPHVQVHQLIIQPVGELY